MAGVVGVWRVSRARHDLSALKGVSSVERALILLTAFRHGDKSLSLAVLAERTGLVKSTILRLAASLQKYQLLARMPDGTFRLEAETLRLGNAYQEAFSLADHVLPALERLAAKTDETAAFYVRSGEERLCLFRVETDSRVRMHVQPGDVFPMDDSAIAQILRRYEAGLPASASEYGVVYYTSGVTDPHMAALATPIFGEQPSFNRLSQRQPERIAARRRGPRPAFSNQAFCAVCR